MLRKIVDTEGRDDDAKTEIWAAEQTKLEGRLRPDPTNRRPNTKPGERWNELARLADLLRKGFDVRLGCVCRPNRCHAESIIREVKALAQKRSAEATSGAGPSSEGASAEGGSDGAAARGASDDPPNEQLEGSADDSEACECEGKTTPSKTQSATRQRLAETRQRTRETLSRPMGYEDDDRTDTRWSSRRG